jgi:hypothetical protein
MPPVAVPSARLLTIDHPIDLGAAMRRLEGPYTVLRGNYRHLTTAVTADVLTDADL